MKTKWGSCNRETGHIWFNVELAKKHPECLEYLAVHEMTHLLERHHGERFTNLMDKYMPTGERAEIGSTGRPSGTSSGQGRDENSASRNRASSSPALNRLAQTDVRADNWGHGEVPTSS